MNGSQKAKSLAQVRNFLQKKYPLINIVRGQGYYYFISDDADMNSKLDRNATTSVMVFNCREQTLDRWMSDLEQLLKGEATKKSLHSVNSSGI